MTNYKCTRRIQFCAGHRVFQHESKCANLHGHNYVAFITAEAEDLDSVGRVVDFSVIKDRVGGWIDECWDHGFILFDQDEDGIMALDFMGNAQKLYTMGSNPTAENMAQELKDKAGELMKPYGIKITKIVLWETENCYAEA